jgi:hypothetical protein
LAAAAQRLSAVVSSQVIGALLQRSLAVQGVGSGSVALAAAAWQMQHSGGALSAAQLGSAVLWQW